MRENRTSGSMRGCRKRATSRRACALLYAKRAFAPNFSTDGPLLPSVGPRASDIDRSAWAGTVLAQPNGVRAPRLDADLVTPYIFQRPSSQSLFNLSDTVDRTYAVRWMLSLLAARSMRASNEGGSFKVITFLFSSGSVAGFDPAMTASAGR